MSAELLHMNVVFIITVGFAYACILGYISQKLKLSPILGYLLAGYFIGPFSPGFVADLEMAEQLAKIGVVLMMFVVGLQFKWEDLASVRNIAIPGAFLQTGIALICTTIVMYLVGWELEQGIIMGLCVGVASSVVIVRMLSEYNLLNKLEGHIGVGWTIVEDFFTIIALLLLPLLALSTEQEAITYPQIAMLVFMALLKFVVLVVLMLTIGKKVFTYIMRKVTQSYSHELLTLSILAVTFVIATGSMMVFGTSIVLGAFIAGLVISQTEARHQVMANTLPLKDAFAVIFFLSIGMLFNPTTIGNNFFVFICLLAIVLVVKSLTAFFFVRALRYPIQTAFVMAAALAQIGEFSLVLAEESSSLKVFPDEGYDLIVACTFFSIGINPLFFALADYLGTKYQGVELAASTKESQNNGTHAVIIGGGTIGRSIARMLKQMDGISIVIEHDLERVSLSQEEKVEVVYGNATESHILEAAKIESAYLLVITFSELKKAEFIIEKARQLNPNLHILVCADKMWDKVVIKNLDIDFVYYREISMQKLSSIVAPIEII